MEAEVQRLSRLFLIADDDDGDEDAEPLVLGYKVAPINVATGQRLTKPQLLSGQAHSSTWLPHEDPLQEAGKLSKCPWECLKHNVGS